MRRGYIFSESMMQTNGSHFMLILCLPKNNMKYP